MWFFRAMGGALNFDATPLILITGFTSENKDLGLEFPV